VGRPPRWRLFVAARPPLAVAHGIYEGLTDVRARHRLARWTQPEQLHLTLVFLGATDPYAVPDLGGLLAQVAARWQAFDVATAEAGGYLNDRRGGVAWLTIGRGRDQMSSLSRDVDELLESHAYEGRPPRPHLTVARRVDEALLADLRAAADNLRVEFSVEALVLYRSHMGPRGRYEELSRHALGAAVEHAAGVASSSAAQ
jgi:RNA 2',3'-cyclic 3'-phosphodiesterase